MCAQDEIWKLESQIHTIAYVSNPLMFFNIEKFFHIDLMMQYILFFNR